MKLTKKNQIMGIVNVTPDSFSDGGHYADAPNAIAHGKALVAQGADVLDLGGQSTRPGFVEVPPAEEIRRLLPVIKGLKDCGVPLSVDTYFPEVAEAAILAGATIINDIKGLDMPGMAEVIAKYPTVQVIIMHSRPRRAESLVEDIQTFYEEKIALCQKHQIPLENICFDPGVGFHKSPAENLDLMQFPEKYRYLNFPLLYGISRKRIIGRLSGEVDPAKRDFGSVTASLYLANQGVEIIRVHQVAGMKAALLTWQALTKKG